MRALIQLIDTAEVTVEGKLVGSSGPGLCIFLGVVPEDMEDTAARLWKKILRLRIFPDADGKTNLSLQDTGGSVLVVSQFTLCADCSHGNRPSFTGAAKPEPAKRLYEAFLEDARADLGESRVGHGEFGAMMDVSLVNKGPFTIWLDTETL